MGNCFSGSQSYSPSQLNATGQLLTHSSMERDTVILLMGPLGSKIIQFAHLATRGEEHVPASESLCGPPRAVIQVFAADLPRRNKTITLVVPTEFDGGNITELSIIDEVQNWQSHRQLPAIDHIIFFPDVGNTYKVRLIPAASYLSLLGELCGQSDMTTVYRHISLVTSPAIPPSQPSDHIPEAWNFLRINGAGEFSFTNTRESVLTILESCINSSLPE